MRHVLLALLAALITFAVNSQPQIVTLAGELQTVVFNVIYPTHYADGAPIPPTMLPSLRVAIDCGPNNTPDVSWQWAGLTFFYPATQGTAMFPVEYAFCAASAQLGSAGDWSPPSNIVTIPPNVPPQSPSTIPGAPTLSVVSPLPSPPP